MNPLAAVQPLFGWDNKDRKPRFGGSSFRLWADNFYITAAHCVEGLCKDQVRAFNCAENNCFETLKIHQHSKADLAVIEVAGEVHCRAI